jgi:hypothetical protein
VTGDARSTSVGRFAPMDHNGEHDAIASEAEADQAALRLHGAVLSPTESISAWFGPVSIQRTFHAQTAGLGAQMVNTLLFTQDQVIALLLGFDDLHSVVDDGPIKTAANEAVKMAPSFYTRQGWQEGPSAKSTQFGALNAKHWVEMVDGLRAAPLEDALKTHPNFALPYDAIQSVTVERHFVNPGLTFHLMDGTRIRFVTFNRDRLSEIADFLKPLLIKVD